MAYNRLACTDSDFVGGLQEFSSQLDFALYSTSICGPSNMDCGQYSTPARGICQVSLNSICKCEPGFSGYDCSISPQVLSVNPEFGPLSGGFSVSIYALLDPSLWGSTLSVIVGGQRSVLVTTVSTLFNNSKQVTLTFMMPTDLRIQCVLSTTIHPSWTPCGVTIELSLAGRLITNNGVRLYLVDFPQVFSFSPDAGYYLGGTVITVTGSNFLDNTLAQIKIGSLPCLSTYRSSLQLLVISPACSAKCSFNADISVAVSFNSINFQNLLGLSFRFFGDIIIEFVVPTTGSVKGGTPVLIFGSNLTSGNNIFCKFGTISVMGVFQVDVKAIKCISPNVEREGLVSLSIALDGQTYSSPSNCTVSPTKCFSYLNPVTVSRVIPTLGPVGGFTRLIIFGNNFYNSSRDSSLCVFGTVSVPMNFERVSDVIIYTCLSPTTNSEGLLSFAISPNGIDIINSSVFFQFYQSPLVIARSGATLLPVGAPLNGGTYLTISGSGFLNSGNGIRVSFISTTNRTQIAFTDAIFKAPLGVKLAAFRIQPCSVNGPVYF